MKDITFNKIANMIDSGILKLVTIKEEKDLNLFGKKDLHLKHSVEIDYLKVVETGELIEINLEVEELEELELLIKLKKISRINKVYG